MRCSCACLWSVLSPFSGPFQVFFCCSFVCVCVCVCVCVFLFCFFLLIPRWLHMWRAWSSSLLVPPESCASWLWHFLLSPLICWHFIWIISRQNICLHLQCLIFSERQTRIFQNVEILLSALRVKRQTPVLYNKQKFKVYPANNSRKTLVKWTVSLLVDGIEHALIKLLSCLYNCTV